MACLAHVEHLPEECPTKVYGKAQGEVMRDGVEVSQYTGPRWMHA